MCGPLRRRLGSSVHVLEVKMDDRGNSVLLADWQSSADKGLEAPPLRSGRARNASWPTGAVDAVRHERYDHA